MPRMYCSLKAYCTTLYFAYLLLLLFCRAGTVAKSDYQLRHVRPSVCLSAWIKLAPTGRNCVKSDFGYFFIRNLWRKSWKIGQNTIWGTSHVLYCWKRPSATQQQFKIQNIVAFLLQHSQFILLTETYVVRKYTLNPLLLSDGNNGYANAPQYYDICTRPV
jgi:hypothetical protein